MEKSYKDSKKFFRKANEIRKPYKPKSSCVRGGCQEGSRKSEWCQFQWSSACITPTLMM